MISRLNFHGIPEANRLRDVLKDTVHRENASMKLKQLKKEMKNAFGVIDCRWCDLPVPFYKTLLNPSLRKFAVKKSANVTIILR